MFRLALIFFGGDLLVKRWKVFLVAGLLTALIGIAVLGDLADGVVDIATGILGSILLVQGVFECLVGATHTRMRRRLQMLRGLAMLVAASLVLDFPWNNAITSGVLFAGAFLFNGLLRVGSGFLIRYTHWRISVALGLGYVVMALLLLTNWPLPDAMNVSFCLGLALLAGGGVLIRGAWRLKHLPMGSRLAAIDLYQHIRYPASGAQALQAPHAEPVAAPLAVPLTVPLTVHIWTAVASTADRIKLPLIERYIVALSRKGRASSGHAALECGPLYISHHPRERLSITAQNALQQARATPENNRPGRWGERYADEAAATRPSTVKVRFHVYRPDYLQAFWNAYREDDTYNFTHRNCSSTVVQAVDAAMEGVFSERPFWRTAASLLVHPDMWLAGSVRVRAESLAWSPGLALDYVRAVRRVTDPRHDLRLHLLRRWRVRQRLAARRRTRAGVAVGVTASLPKS